MIPGSSDGLLAQTGGSFPALIGTANGNITTRSTSLVVTFDAAAVAGQLIRIIVATEVNSTAPSTPAGYTQIVQTTATVTLSIYEKIAAGGETGVTITQGNNRSSWIADRIGPVAAVAVAGTSVSASTVNPNPPSLTPAAGTKDYLWAACVAIIINETVSVYPANYTDGVATAPTATAVVAARAIRQLTAATEDPGTFTISAASASVTNTIAVAAV